MIRRAMKFLIFMASSLSLLRKGLLMCLNLVDCIILSMLFSNSFNSSICSTRKLTCRLPIYIYIYFQILNFYDLAPLYASSFVANFLANFTAKVSHKVFVTCELIAIFFMTWGVIIKSSIENVTFCNKYVI